MQDIRIEPQPGGQTHLFESPAREVLFGGEAGPGKSWALLALDIEELMRTPDLRIMVMRKTYTDMNDLILKAKGLYEPLGAKFYPSHPFLKRPCFVWPRFDSELRKVGDDGALTLFGYMATFADTERIQGLEIQGFRVDEVGQWKEPEYLYLFSRLRSGFRPDGSTIHTSVISTANPGTLWLKRRFIDKLAPLEIKAYKKDRKSGREVETHIDDPEGMTRQFIPASRQDNSYLDLEAYEASLGMLGDEEYRKLALGSWDVAMGDKMLFNPQWVDNALSGNVDHTETTWDAIGADVAHGGGDRAVIVRGNGNRVLTISSWRGMTNDFAALVHKEATTFPDVPVGVAIDSNGIGAGEANTLQFGGVIQIQPGNVAGLPEGPYRIDPGLPHVERCVLKDDLYDIRFRGSMKFKSFKAQAYHKFANALRLGQVDLSALNVGRKPEDMIGRFGGRQFDDLDDLYEEFAAIEYSDDDGFFQVTDKKRLRKVDKLGRSPDYLDALVYWWWIHDRPIELETESEAERYERWVEKINDTGGHSLAPKQDDTWLY